MGKMNDDEVAQIGKALGDPNRLAIYTQIAQCDELFCGEMHAKHAISAPTLSHHLKVLRQTGIVGSEREGLWAYYYVIPDALKELSTWLI